MAYTKTDWQDGITPLSATNLNKMEQGIESAHTGMADLAAMIGQVSYYQNTEPTDKTQKNTWYNPNTGLLYIADGTKYIPIPPVQILEEITSFLESNITITHNNTEVSNGSISLSGTNTNGNSLISFTNTPLDIKAWDLATYQNTEDGETVTVDIEKSITVTIGTTVTRTNDNYSSSTSAEYGIQIKPKKDMKGIRCTLSSKVLGMTLAKLYDNSNSQLLKTIDITGLSAGQTFDILEVNLQSDKVYNLVVSNSGASYTYGYQGSPTFPYLSSDIEIINGASGANGTETVPCNISSVTALSAYTWQTAFSDIGQNFDISTISNTEDIRFKINLSRANTANNPSCDYLARRFVR